MLSRAMARNCTSRPPDDQSTRDLSLRDPRGVLRDERVYEARERWIEPGLDFAPAAPRPLRCEDRLNAVAHTGPVIRAKHADFRLKEYVLGSPQQAQQHEAVPQTLKLVKRGEFLPGSQVQIDERLVLGDLEGDFGEGIHDLLEGRSEYDARVVAYLDRSVDDARDKRDGAH